MSSIETRKRLSDEERAERRVQDREAAREAVERLRSSDGWRQWLRTRAAFRTYSLGNQLIIAMSHPTATRVAGFRAWLGLGYAVRKGEQAGIRIWAPCPPSRRQLERRRKQGGDPADRPRTFFRPVPVWAQDQVDPLPPPAVPAPLEFPIVAIGGDELADRIPALLGLAGELEVEVRFEELFGPEGSFRPAVRSIVIEQSHSANGKVATLCHELGHALIALDRAEQDPVLDYAGEELVVESVAFSCTRSLGVQTDANSIPYLAGWAERSDIEVIEQTAGLIDQLARRIETALHFDRDNQDQVDGAEVEEMIA